MEAIGRSRRRTQLRTGAAVLGVLGLVVGVALVLRPDWWPGQADGQQDGPAARARPTSSAMPEEQSVLAGGTLHQRRAAATPGACTHGVTGRFVPVSADATGAARGAAVLALSRDAAGVPGVPPLTSAGKNAFAWDAPGLQPGAPHGHVLLNAHTWPDGSALGNRLLAGLHLGGQVVLRGAAGQQLCYRVVDRVEVPADQPYPRYYRGTGPPRVAIVVCSGQRLGPGQWTHRTVWFAKPVAG